MIAVLGATGKIGRATLSRLRQQRVPVRAVVRETAKATDLGSGVDIAVADLADTRAVRVAIDGAETVQVICPTNPRAANASGEMVRMIESICAALEHTEPDYVVAISDYGADVPQGTGITMLFRFLEERLRRVRADVTFVRSAEHMQNWARQVPTALKTGTLATLHHPVTKQFPTVSASDVGLVAADLLLEPATRVVYVEGPRRYSAQDVAEAIGVQVTELPQAEWVPTLTRGGISQSYAELVAELFVAHNSGRIDVEDGVTDVRRGTTELRDVLREIADQRVEAVTQVG
ncbi:MAG TPA: NAD(P)H-binding protein [Gemmatimonadaceae bacterium]|nr:NAD(P)H-binding protein [Gemmatimonadaceae bacterium]